MLLCPKSEHQWLMALHFGNAKGYAATLTHSRTIALLSRQQSLRKHLSYILQRNVNRASTILGLESSTIKGLCNNVNPESNYRPPFEAKIFTTTSLLRHNDEHYRSGYDCRPCIFDDQGAVQGHWSIFELLAAILGSNALNDILPMPETWGSIERERF